MYADDTKIYDICDNDVHKERIQEDLSKVHEWFGVWQLNLAVEKCEMISFTKYSGQNFDINGSRIPETTKLKDLGVWVSNDLKFSHHCNLVAKRANQRSNLIFRTFLCRNPDFLMNLFNIYVRPIVEYCTPVYMPMTWCLIR